MNFSKSVYVLNFRKEFFLKLNRRVYQFHHNTDRCGCLFPVETGLEPVRTLAQRCQTSKSILLLLSLFFSPFAKVGL